MAAKCPITLEQFRETAKPLEMVLGGKEMIVPTKEFSTGSYGWYFNGKVTIRVGDTLCEVQCGCNFTLVGSKTEKPPAS